MALSSQCRCSKGRYRHSTLKSYRFNYGRRRQKQIGVALITVLMVFAIGTVLISKIVLQRSIDVQRVSAMVSRAQAQYYARAGEDLAILGLRAADELDDATNSKNSDNLDEVWVQPISYDVDGFGQVAVQIIDLNRFYNINNLLEPNYEINERELDRFRYLLSELDIREDLAENVADWLDLDDDQEGYRSESESYINTPLGYRAANQRMHDIRELLQVEGFDSEILEKLEPHVIALPIGDILRMNVNTATRYALTTLDTDTQTGDNRRPIGLTGADDIIDARPYLNTTSSDLEPSGVSNIVTESSYVLPTSNNSQDDGDLDEEQTGNGVPNRGVKRIAASSDYFQINVRANYGGQVAYLTTVVRQEGIGETAKFYVLSRNEQDNSHRFLQQF